MMIVGLFRGISSELSSLVGLAVGVTAGFLLYGPACSCAKAFVSDSQGGGMLKGATIVIDVVFSLIIGGLVRILVKKFVSFLMGKAIDRGLGVLSGLIKGVLIVSVLTGFGLVSTGEAAKGPIVAHSPIITFIGSVSSGLVTGSAK